VNDGMRQKVVELLRCRRVMTLAVAAGRRAWCAPVYYVYENRALFFFSRTDSRHITHGLGKTGVAASVHADSHDWRGIKGVQMEGSIDTAGCSGDALRAFGLYQARFSALRELLLQHGPETVDPARVESLLRVRWYQFIPQTLFFVDNTSGLGHRQRVVL